MRKAIQKVVAIFLVLLGPVKLFFNWLTGVDFIITRSQDPGWLKVVLDFISHPTPTFDLVVFLLGAGWLSFLINKSRASSRGDSSGLIIHATGHVLPPKQEKSAKPQEPKNILPKKRTFIDEGKIRLIDHAFRHIQSQCIPQYDRYCDQTIGPWKYKLLEISVMQFSENCWKNIQESSGRVNDLIKILNENKIYKDVYDQLIGIGDQHNHVIAKFRDFEEKVKRFPEKATAGLLGLVEDEGRDMCEAVGKYGQWLREKSEVLVKMRSDEVQL